MPHRSPLSAALVTPAGLARAPGARDDVALVHAFRGGDRAAFEELVRRHQRVVRAIAFRAVRNRDAAEDLSQRVFVAALESIDALRGPFRPWLLRIAVNMARNHIRDSGRLVLRIEDTSAAELSFHPHPEEALHHAHRVQRVRDAVLSLPPRQREVTLLRIDGQLSFAEIAEIIGVTENSAKVSFHHATRRLREQLREDLVGP